MSSSTLTFLFTDIEGSTQLWEQHPEAMKTALANHDAILRLAIESHGGHVFKTVGDAFCAAFPSAPDAVSAALDAQRAISAENWGETVIKVRMGLHSGAAEVRDNDYFGPTLNRVARLMSAGHGGQTLLSAITRELVQTNLPHAVELRDMGERGLKDLIRPEHIYQLTAVGLPTDFPPLKTLEAFRSNLPVQLTSFIGREKEISAVKSLIVENHLITLTGSGGTGKTRLSLQVAADLLDSFPDGVWFVELAPLSDPALVPQTIATTVGLHQETGRSLLEILTNYLRGKKVLLILDNCEHVVEASAQLAEALLQACPTLRILVSSREALGIPGEATYRVPSLSLPDTRRVQSAETLTQCEAARLFMDRAKTTLPTFAITNENAHAVGQVCARLDGIPLAIELAAARVRILKVEQIAERLDDRFRLLTGGSRTALPRQQTLRAMIDWSHDLLPEPERALLRRLSVFAGGWTLEAAETICQGLDVLDSLTQLINKSLVVVDADIMPVGHIVPVGHESSETRYRMLETIRQYAREKLAETSEGLEVRNRHLDYFLSLAERAEPQLTGPGMPEWVKRLNNELDNLRAALEWSLEQDVQLGLRLASVLVRYWLDHNDSLEGMGWLSQLMDQPAASIPNRARAQALIALGFLYDWQFDGVRAQPFAEQGLAIYQALGDQRGLAFALLVLGIALCLQDDCAAARPLAFESLALYRMLDDRLGIAEVLHYLGLLVDKQDYARVRAYLEESLGLCRELGHVFGIADRLTSLGRLAYWSGDFAGAHAWMTEFPVIDRSLGRSVVARRSQSILGELAMREGDYEQARAYLEESLSDTRERGEINPSYWLLAFLGHVAMRQGDYARARSFFTEAHQGFKATGPKIGVIFALEGLASLAVAQSQPERAAQLFAWTDAYRESVDDLRPPVEQADVDHDLAVIHAQLDETTFAAAQSAGRGMTMAEAITYALELTYPSINPYRPDVLSGGQDD